MHLVHALIVALAIAPPAAAGTIQLSAPTPVGVKLDGEWVSHGGTVVTMTDVTEGGHRVQVCNLMGQPIAFVDVTIGEAPVHLSYAEKRLEVVGEIVEADSPSADDAPAPLSQAELTDLQRDLLKGSLKARRERLAEAAAAHWFQMRHVTVLISAFDALDDQVWAAETLAPRTLDPENVGALDAVLPTGAHRDRARAAFTSDE